MILNADIRICLSDVCKLSMIFKQGEFDWDKKTQSSILAAFFYGYIITQIPGGWLSDRFGGYKVFGVAMGISGICTILLPVCARASLVMVYVLRFILGFVMVRNKE